MLEGIAKLRRVKARKLSVHLGFPLEQCIAALSATDDNWDAAAEWIMQGGAVKMEAKRENLNSEEEDDVDGEDDEGGDGSRGSDSSGSSGSSSEAEGGDEPDENMREESGGEEEGEDNMDFVPQGTKTGRRKKISRKKKKRGRPRKNPLAATTSTTITTSTTPKEGGERRGRKKRIKKEVTFEGEGETARAGGGCSACGVKQAEVREMEDMKKRLENELDEMLKNLRAKKEENLELALAVRLCGGAPVSLPQQPPQPQQSQPPPADDRSPTKTTTHTTPTTTTAMDWKSVKVEGRSNGISKPSSSSSSFMEVKKEKEVEARKDLGQELQHGMDPMDPIDLDADDDEENIVILL